MIDGGPERLRPRICSGPGCTNELPAPKGTGRIRETCSDRCRRAKSRVRAALPWPPSPPPGYPTDPETVRRRTAEAISLVLAGAPPAPPEDQLAQALLELSWLAYELARLERELAPRLGARAADMARVIAQHRHRLFPELEEALS